MVLHGSSTESGDDASRGEATLVAGLQARDEAAFCELLDRYHQPLVRFLRGFLSSPDLAEEVVQETWIAAFEGISRFEGRSSLKTWLFRIAANRARSRMRRESRLIPFAGLFRRGQQPGDDDDTDDLVPRLFDSAHGMWSSTPARWEDEPDTRLLSNETLDVARATIERLPPMQAAVITLRDVEGWTSAEVRTALDLSEANQRVVLHRARARVRAALERHLEGDLQ